MKTNAIDKYWLTLVGWVIKFARGMTEFKEI